MSNVNMDRLVTTFCELVKIPSESHQEKEFITYLENVFRNMGGKTAKDDFGNLVVKFDAKNSNSKTPIAFCAHADTVKPGVGIDPIISNGVIKSNGNTILGADDKAGISEIIEMIRTAEKHPPVEIIITCCEEDGTLGSVNLDYSMINSKMIYVLDIDAAEKIIVGGPTMITMNVNYKGKSAHAGIEPEKGRSAVIAAAKAVLNLRLGKLDDETTANVGVSNGGEIRNGVPENARILAECRCLNHEKAVALANEMEQVFRESAKETGTEVTIETKTILNAYYLPETSTIIQLAVSALKKNGVTPKIVTTRAGADSAIFNLRGIPAATIGAGYRNCHSRDEYAIIDEMVSMVKILNTIVEDLA